MVNNGGAGLVRDELRPFAEALTNLLDTRDMARIVLADILDVSPSTVSNWTLGRVRPRPENVEALEDCLLVPRGHLARQLGYLPVTETIRPGGETIAEFLEREALLPPRQQELIVQLHAELVRLRGPRNRRSVRNG